MPKWTINILCVVTSIMFLSGCATGMTARTYVEDKERVDQEMSGGNFGYFSGTPVPDDRSDYKKTRRIYVLEVTKETDEEEVEIELPPRKRYNPPAPTSTSRPQPRDFDPIVLPSFDDEAPMAPTTSTSFVDYEVQKNDTLQKISKKFYDSYSKWTLIHNANKDVLKDPNKIKPGMTLRIPVEQ